LYSKGSFVASLCQPAYTDAGGIRYFFTTETVHKRIALLWSRAIKRSEKNPY
jgi:hypothetical protein